MTTKTKLTQMSSKDRACVCVVPLSRVTRGLYDRATRKVRKEKGSAFLFFFSLSLLFSSHTKIPYTYFIKFNIKKCVSNKQTFTTSLSRVSLFSLSLSLSLFVEKCHIETTKASQGGERRKEYRRHHLVLLLLISHRLLRHLRDNKT